MLAASSDVTTVNPELFSSQPVHVTLTTSGGFTGDVNLSAAVVDANNQPMTGWMVMFDKSTVTITADGTTPVVATLAIPSKNAGLSATLNISATSSLGTTQLAPIAVTVTNQVSFYVSVNAGGTCDYPAGLVGGNPVQVSVGTLVRFVNTGTAQIVIHSGDNASGICHEGQGTGAGCPANAYSPQGTPGMLNQNDAYIQKALVAGSPFRWYCHSPGQDLNTTLQVVN
jgi:hypothetical protein